MKAFFTMVLVSALATAFLAASTHAYADDSLDEDICESRPDLCGAEAPPEPRAKPKQKKVQPQASAPRPTSPVKKGGWKTPEEVMALKRERGEAPVRPARPRGPASTSQINDAADDGGFAPPETVKPASRAAVPRAPAVAPAVTFDSYMQANSSHPALQGRISNRQQAFAEVVKPATMTMPTQMQTDTSTGAGAPPAANSNPTSGANVPLPGANPPSSDQQNPSSFQY